MTVGNQCVEGKKPMCRGKPLRAPGKELISPQPPGVTLLCPTDAPRMAPDHGPKCPSQTALREQFQEPPCNCYMGPGMMDGLWALKTGQSKLEILLL